VRTAFVDTLTRLAANDDRIMLLVGDLGFGVVTEFARRFPKQFLNVGVAEQNMAGVAAGLALSGKIVFTYSIANFPILRCLEQIRNDICYHNANVISVSVGGGLCYGALGMTHHGTEDLAIMRALPNMQVIAPGDPIETEAATEYLAKGVGPAYLRLGRAGEPVIYKTKNIDWHVGKALELQDGKDLTLITTGGMLHTTINVARRLSANNITARVLSMHTLKPIDESAILKAAHDTNFVITIEEHSIIGGLGGGVAEILAGIDYAPPLLRLGLPSEFTKYVGGQTYLKDKYGLSETKLYSQIKSFIA